VKAADLRPGMVVAVWTHGTATLGDAGLNRAIVLGDAGPFSGRPVRVFYNRYAGHLLPASEARWAGDRHSTGWLLAVEESMGRGRPMSWRPQCLTGRNVAGPWEDHVAAMEARRLKRMAEHAAAEAQRQKDAEWYGRAKGRLDALGVRAYLNEEARSFRVQGEDLARLLELAADGLALRQLDPSVHCRACQSQAGCPDHDGRR
jgi:hypothetical protein